MKYIRIILFLTACFVVGCAWNHPTNTTTAEQRCNSLKRWDDCARSPNCMLVRDCRAEDKRLEETFSCVHKYNREVKKNND